jgi:hypothetical protein
MLSFVLQPTHHFRVFTFAVSFYPYCRVLIFLYIFVGFEISDIFVSGDDLDLQLIFLPRMTDLTAGRAKCLLPVGNLPLLWFPLKMLENCGFQTVIVTVPEAVQKEVHTACFYSV